MLPRKEETDAAWPRTRLQHDIVAPELSSTVGGLERGGGQAESAPRLQQPTILGFQLPHPTLGTGILRQGCGAESPSV